MMQGDSYRVPLLLTINGEPVTDKTVAEVEVMLGNLRKTTANNEVVYSETEGAWMIHLTQEDTFRLRGNVRTNVRVKFLSGDVIGVDLGLIDIETSISKVVL